jgi:hypothetical protein
MLLFSIIYFLLSSIAMTIAKSFPTSGRRFSYPSHMLQCHGMPNEQQSTVNRILWRVTNAAVSRCAMKIHWTWSLPFGPSMPGPRERT